MKLIKAGTGGFLLGAALFACWLLLSSVRTDLGPAKGIAFSSSSTGPTFLGSSPADSEDPNQKLERKLGPRNSALFRIAMVRILSGHFEEALETVKKLPAGIERDTCLESIADTIFPNPDFPSALEGAALTGPPVTDEQLVEIVQQLVQISNELSDDSLRVRYATRASRLLVALEKKKSEVLGKLGYNSQTVLASADSVADKISVPGSRPDRSWAFVGHEAVLLGGILFSSLTALLAVMTHLLFYGVGGVISGFVDSLGKSLGGSIATQVGSLIPAPRLASLQPEAEEHPPSALALAAASDGDVTIHAANSSSGSNGH